jgi:hypothetical protein
MAAVVFAMLIVPATSAAASFSPRNQPPVTVEDHVVVPNDVTYVDVPVLKNDYDPDGDKIDLVRVFNVEGGKAEIKKGGIVRFYIEFDPQPGFANRLLGHGYYSITDGIDTSKGEWFVWR